MPETIVALSTPSGESAIAVIRLSGGACAEIARGALGVELQPRKAAYAQYKAADGRALDDVVAVFFAAPHSYTGEDCLEISAHGNPFIIRSIIDDAIARGARAAAPGEFTRRAFENGKMDLSQAEAVALLISARSDRSIRAARKQLSGELGRRISAISEKLVDALALIEAYIDFPEDDLPEDDKGATLSIISECARQMEALADTAKYAPLVHGGIDAVIAGAPNAGKSSLLNMLLGSDRAIVSAQAGTTRDFISEKISIGENAVNLTDTAGLRRAEGEIETLGVERARRKMAGADICLVVVDAATLEIPPEISAQTLSERGAIIVANKCDLPEARPQKVFENFPGFARAEVSCASGAGLEALKSAIAGLIDKYHISPAADDILVSARHARALLSAKECALAAAENISGGAPAELAASDLRAALESLGEIVGKTDNERVLDKIFSKFCIGK